MLYIICWIPYSIIVIMQISRSSEYLAYILSTFFAYLPYLQAILLPYACIMFMPEIKEKLLARMIIILHLIQCKPNRIEPIHIGHNTTFAPSRLTTMRLSYQR